MKQMKRQFLQGLATVSASLLVISMGVEAATENRTEFINTRLGTSNYEVIKTDSESNGIYYKSEFNSLEELLKAKSQEKTNVFLENKVDRI